MPFLLNCVNVEIGICFCIFRKLERSFHDLRFRNRSAGKMIQKTMGTNAVCQSMLIFVQENGFWQGLSAHPCLYSSLKVYIIYGIPLYFALGFVSFCISLINPHFLWILYNMCLHCYMQCKIIWEGNDYYIQCKITLEGIDCLKWTNHCG